MEFYKLRAEDIKYNIMNLPQVVFEVTDACNLRCRYCGYAGLYEGYDKREDKMLPFQYAKRIIDYLYTFWASEYDPDLQTPISFGFYGGEPLLNFSLVQQIINYIRELPNVGKTYRFNMTTNAMLLDRYMDYLVENNFNITISLDGDESCQGFRVDARGKNSFERVFRNVCLLRDKYPDFFLSNVNFNSVLHSKNSVARIYDFIEREFGKKPRISPLTTSGVREDKLQEFKKTYKNYYDDVHSSVNCEALQERLFIYNPETNMLMNYLFYKTGNVFPNYTSLFINSSNSYIIPTGTCTPFSKKLFVTVNGRILQCERINQDFSLGQVDSDGVRLDFDKIANQYNEYIERFNTQCSVCANVRQCSHCILQADKDFVKKKCSVFISHLSTSNQLDSVALDYLRNHPHLYREIIDNITIK